ncbi:MAG: 50S ribosomal protein L5 [Candidatus Paceibacterota bacterium]
MKSVKEKQKDIFTSLKERFGYTNSFAAPALVKVVVSVGTGSSAKNDKGRNDFVAERLSKITGQKPRVSGARTSIASFKLREKDPIGLSVTLRGGRMYDFLDRLFNVAVPRIRDFRGFDPASIDAMGNITIGLAEHNIFPETADEELRDVFGLSVTIVTTARNREEAGSFLSSLGMPFKREKKEERPVK